ncbi:hypothetical protein ACFWVC_07250 [Streptomyces sp. NPDC058691]|uniref:hypothetical protein n=1 Tax=Streptomyces sp. NPDC058691 TaxID=3346601 RepID=UPI00364B066D
MVFELDPGYFGSDAAISDNLGSLDLHAPHCEEPGGPGHIVILDKRGSGHPAEWHHR